MKKEVWEEIKVLFSGWEVLFHLIILFFVNYGIFFTISKNMVVSIGIGLVGMVFFFYVFTYQNKKLKEYQSNLKELMKYVSNMNFYLNTGKNVLHAFEGVGKSANGQVKKDIEKSFEKLKDAVLDTKHFERYKFTALDQYHRNLDIYYERGGNPREMFGKIGRNIIFELKKRDELYRKRKVFALNVYMLLLMVGAFSFVFRFMIPSLWDIYLSFPTASVIHLVMTYLFFLLNLYLLQKKTIDISVRL